MREFMISALALGAALILPGQAAASDTQDRTAAIQLCRAEIAAQAGEAAEVRLDHVQVRPRQVRVHLDVWRDGALSNVRCDVSRRGELQIAAISPPFALAAAASATGAAR